MTLRARWAESPWDGFSRAPLRVGIGAVVALDLLGLGASAYFAEQSARSHPGAPHLLLALAGSSLALLAVVCAGLWGTLGVFTGKERVVSGGLLSLLALGLLSEAHAAVVGGPARNFYPAGAALAGWLFGLAYARASSARDDNALAEAGACGAIAATYVGAAMSKVLTSGLAWAEHDGLRGIILSQHRVGDTSVLGLYEHFVVDHASVSQALAAITLLTQGGACLWLGGRRLRALWGTMILAFHVNVWLLTGIKYLEPMVLVLLFSFPWPRAWKIARSTEPTSESRDVDGERKALLFTLAAIAALVAAAWITGLRGYTGLHHTRG